MKEFDSKALFSLEDKTALVIGVSKGIGKEIALLLANYCANVSSQLAFVGHNNRSVYSSSKGGITQLTKSLAIKLASYNINVNAIAPTFVETSMTKEVFKDAKLEEEVLSKIPLGRIAQPKDLYGAFIYLSSNAADMVTGHTIVVDGGWTTW